MEAKLDELTLVQLQRLSEAVSAKLRARMEQETAITSPDGSYRFNTTRARLETKGGAGWGPVQPALDALFRAMRQTNLIPEDYRQLYAIARQMERIA